jgi:hypothetical protein
MFSKFFRIDSSLAFEDGTAARGEGFQVDKQEVAFERLHALVRKGYKAEIGVESPGGTIALRHLGKAPDLVLHADGRVEPLGGRIPRHKRSVTEITVAAGTDAHEVAFLKFLEGVPRPTRWDRTRPLRKKYVYLPTALVAVWGACITITVLVTGM